MDSDRLARVTQQYTHHGELSTNDIVWLIEQLGRAWAKLHTIHTIYQVVMFDDATRKAIKDVLDG